MKRIARLTAVAAVFAVLAAGAVFAEPFAQNFSTSVVYVKDPSFVPPVDFSGLKRTNPDIYAWITIQGTNINYPLLQSPTDDGYYLHHSRTGASSSNGELYTESAYNYADMLDPVTVVYGHNMRSGKMFGRLQTYYKGDIRRFRKIAVCTPESEFDYTVFAAVPYDSVHLLASYDFNSPAVFDRFFSKFMKTRVLGGTVDRSVTLTSPDKVLVLSTCLSGNHNDRFLVMARLTAVRSKLP